MGVGRRQPTEQSKRPQNVHPRKRRKPQLQEIHDTPQQRRHSPGFRHQILQRRHFHLDTQFLRDPGGLGDVLGFQTLLFGGGGEDLGAEGAGEFGGERFDEFLEEGGEGAVGALELGFRVCKEGLKVVVGGGHAVDEVFEDEGESVRSKDESAEVLQSLEMELEGRDAGTVGETCFRSSSWDSLEMEKTRLLTAARFSCSRTTVISSSSFFASGSETV